MPTYRGNRGNLLQHWVLVDVLEQLSRNGPSRLCYIDAHSMSPTATRSPKAATDPTAPEFDRFCAALQGSSSTYEQTWQTLTRSIPCEYPSSAAFVRSVWTRPVHLSLCEADPTTANEIAVWLSGLPAEHTTHDLFRGKWQSQFQRGLPIGFPGYLVSFDPNMYDRHVVASPKPENMYGSDATLSARAIAALPHVPLVIQLSTYNVNGANSQPDVIANLVPHFETHGLSLAACVRADKSMMSLLFTRDFSLDHSIERRFQEWHAEGKARAGAA
jgi:hypothetical protein